MMSRSAFAMCTVKLELFLILCISIASLNALDTGTVAPLTVDNPVSSEKLIDHKDFKKFETRFHDPPPEFYKGPSSSNYDSYSLKYNGQSQPPSQRPANFVSSGYYNPYLDKHGFYGALNQKDRVSIGGGYYSGSEFNSNGYAGSDRVRPYGSPQPVDIPANGYNSQGINPQSFYGGAPGYDGTFDQGYDGGNIWPDKMNHLSKSHLLPLAGAALIGIAAALLVNPVLLQLGTVAGKRRRRRDTTRQLLPPSNGHNIAYRGHILQ